MALIDCRECGHRISEEAAHCPACGAPRRKIEPKGGLDLRAAFITLAVVAVPLALSQLLTLGSGNADGQAAEDAVRARRIVAATAAMRLLASQLREPSSVNWQAVSVNDDGTLTCLDYRARNGFGGYAQSKSIVSSATGVDNSPAALAMCDSSRFRDITPDATREFDKR